MYSQCPECLTRFRVPAAALRAAHGTVRCGRCGSAFDALPRLSDTLQVDGPASALGRLDWRDGVRTGTRLADMHPHGTWIEWLQPDG